MLLGEQIHLLISKLHTFIHYPLFCVIHHLAGAFMLTALLPLAWFIVPYTLPAGEFSHGIDNHVNVHIFAVIMTIRMNCHNSLMSRSKFIKPVLTKLKSLLHGNRITRCETDNIMMCLYILHGIVLSIRSVGFNTLCSKAVHIAIHTGNQIVFTLHNPALFIQNGHISIFIKLTGQVFHRIRIKSVFY